MQKVEGSSPFNCDPRFAIYEANRQQVAAMESAGRLVSISAGIEQVDWPLVRAKL
jgi:hypothetical protein